jgi:hypothetical protein
LFSANQEPESLEARRGSRLESSWATACESIPATESPSDSPSYTPTSMPSQRYDWNSVSMKNTFVCRKSTVP